MKKDKLIFLIGRIQYKAGKLLTHELKAHHIMGLAPSHGEILGSLMMRGPLSMSEIARIIDKEKSTITVLVNKLIKMGYVEKTKHGTDNRISLVALSMKGEALRPAFKIISNKLKTKAYKDISDEEKETMFRLLTKLNDNF
ncbi:MAG: MarR family transcriptional regulator [Syntrophales bacterium]|jgi:DNA-binding MarR family transcriptional regulator|nr:MarR family transcriptional regulator [Syntrophales bacterium]